VNHCLIHVIGLPAVAVASGRFCIGSKTNHHPEFEGALDDIRFYNRALSAAEVKALYDFEKP
jgi:hypothetical protein